MRLTIRLHPSEADKLASLAQEERRPVRRQAEYILARALAERDPGMRRAPVEGTKDAPVGGVQ